MALLGNSKTVISHQAAMAANRAVIPPIPELRAAGCPIANGTDNNTNDLFEVMRIALVTERIARNKDDDPNPGLQPQPEDLPPMSPGHSPTWWAPLPESCSW